MDLQTKQWVCAQTHELAIAELMGLQSAFSQASVPNGAQYVGKYAFNMIEWVT